MQPVIGRAMYTPTVVAKDMKVNPISKDPEDKEYLICTTTNIRTEWSLVRGRKAAYDYIKDFLDDADMDCFVRIKYKESFVLVEGVTLENRKSLIEFVKYAQKIYQDDMFDLDYFINNNSSINDSEDDSSLDVIPISDVEPLDNSTLLGM